MLTQPWWRYWWDPIVLAQLQVITGIVGGLLALLALVYAWRVARRQFKMMDDQGAIVARQSELMEEQAATSRRIENITERQGHIAEVQHKIMLDQLGLDPVWWTSSERRIRCPQWRKREADGLVGGSRMNSSSRPFA